MRKTFVISFLVSLLFSGILIVREEAFSGDDGNKNRKVESRFAKVLGIDRPFWTPNRIGDYITNNGQIVSHIPTSSSGMEWPVSSNNHICYASGIWLAGVKSGEIVTTAAEYISEFQPGNVFGLSAEGEPAAANSNDPRFKVYIINQEDIANPSANPDYINWPVADGAPVDENGKPLLLGTSTAWAVFNDLDEVLHARLFGSKPIGVEVQMTAWAFFRPDALGDMMFFKFKMINKSRNDVTDAYVAFWADIDIGDAADLIGCDTTLSLGYNYKTQQDAQYGSNPPAIGYDFLQGPIVPAPGDTANISGRKVPGFRNLLMTSFSKYIGGGPPQYSDPEVASEAYIYMQGFDKIGNPIIDPTTGQPTKFWHTGDPTADTGWLDDSHSDKRFLMSSGPFTLAAGDTQEVVGAIVIAQGKTPLESVELLKRNDLTAQYAYEHGFAIPVAPPSPIVSVYPDTASILLTWNEAVESYMTTDYFAVDDSGNPAKYTFQGYNVYQLDAPAITADAKIKKIASFDLIDGVVHIRDDVFIPELGQVGNILVQDAIDNGVQRFLRITEDAFFNDSPLVYNQPYYFAVTAYAYKAFGSPKILESPKQVITARPQSPPLGTQLTTPPGDTLEVNHSGVSDGEVYPIVLSPAALTGHSYEVRFRETSAGTVYDIWDVTTNVKKDTNRTNQGDPNRPFDYPIVDGVMIKVIGAPNDYADKNTDKSRTPSKVFDIQRPFWTPNRIGLYMTNNGQLISHIPTSNAGMEWPLDSNDHVVYASGLWLAGMKNGELVTAAANFNTEFQPGVVTGHSAGIAGTPADPLDNRFKVYIIDENDFGDPPSSPDFINWPIADGAPVNASGKPRLLGTTTAWAVFNDFDQSLHDAALGSKPMGVEVQMTAWAYDRGDALGDMVFFGFKFINKSGEEIFDTYVAFFADIDIGNAFDLVGCDSSLALGYGYKTQADGLYGVNPPAVGYDFLQRPIVPSPGDTARVSGKRIPDFKNLPMFFPRIEKSVTSFHEPGDGEAQQAYNLIRGLDSNGQPLINPLSGEPTMFYYPGDPLVGTGWVDTLAYDKRLLVSSGPFTFADGDTQEVVCAILIAQGATGLESVQVLKQNVSLAQMAYDNQWVITDVVDKPAFLPNDYSLQQNYPNPFNPSTSFEFSIPRYEFVSLKIYNLLGEEVAIVVEEKRAAGLYKVNWNAANLSSGIYFYRFQAGDFVKTRKLAVVK